MKEFDNVRFNSGQEELFNAAKNTMEINIFNAVIATFVKFPSLVINHQMFAKSLAAEGVLRLQKQFKI